MYFDDYLVEEDTTINENYTKYIDNPIIADIESYTNDYTIFEATLKRDFYEATGVLNEEGDQNFFQKIWDKILHVLKTIKEKVASIVNYFSEMWDKHQKEKINKIKMKYYKYYKVSNRADLNNLSINFTLPNVKVFNNGIFTVSADVESMLGEVPNFEKIKAKGNVSFNNKAELNIHRNKKNRKGEEVSKLKGKSYIASDIHNYVWGDEKKGEVEHPFKYITPVQLLDIIDCKQDGLKYIKKLKENLIKEINTQEKLAQSYKKSASKDKDDHAKTLASVYLSLLSDYQTVAVHYFSAFLKEYKAVFNAFVKLYIKGGEKLKQIYGEVNTTINPDNNPTLNHDNETRENPNTDKEESKEESFYDNSYLDAVVETTMFEFALE